MTTDEKPVRVLMLSKDPTLLSVENGSGDGLARHVDYAHLLAAKRPGSSIRIVTFSLKNATAPYTEPTLQIFGTNSIYRAMFVPDVVKILPRVFSDGWRPTVITTQEPYEEGQLGFWLSRYFEARFVPQLHFDLTSEHWSEESRLNPIRRTIGIRTLRRSDAIRVVSEEQKLKLVQKIGIPAHRLRVVPVSVSFEPTKLDRDTCKANLSPRLIGRKVVLFVGRLVAQKNMALWIDVAKAVFARDPDTRFLIAGDGPQAAEIESRSRACGLDEAFVFLGCVPYKQLPEVYAAAELFLLTSHYEGFGRVLVEAQLAGLPVVATEVTGPGDIVTDGETGYLCPLGDERALSDAVLSLLADDEKRTRFGTKGMRDARIRFDRKRLAEALVDLWLSA